MCSKGSPRGWVEVVLGAEVLHMTNSTEYKKEHENCGEAWHTHTSPCASFSVELNKKGQLKHVGLAVGRLIPDEVMAKHNETYIRQQQHKTSIVA
jgi:hypothetical protein